MQNVQTATIDYNLKIEDGRCLEIRRTGMQDSVQGAMINWFDFLSVEERWIPVLRLARGGCC